MFNKNRIAGILLITGAIALLIPYTILTIVFEYPAILRQDTTAILTRFHDGGSSLIWTWFAFAVTGIPLIPAYILLGQQYETQAPLVRMATVVGVTGLIVQMIGLLRWTFVVPVLAHTFMNAGDDATRAATIVVFKTIHQFAGVLLGEHLGQLFTVAWTVMMCLSFIKLKLFPQWLSWSGIVSSVIYLLAQPELFATIMRGIPVWELAGFAGSTLWLTWLIITGFYLLKRK